MFSPVSVCLSVCLLSALLKTTDQIFMKFNGLVDIIQGPIDQILSDFDDKWSHRFSENNSIQNCRTESPQNKI